MSDDILQEQIAYYRARASEYDEWFYRVGRYDRGEELNRQWFSEVETLMRTIHSLKPVDHTLELACGTGIWTRELAHISQQITAIDASAEMIAINQHKLQDNRIHYQQADLFNWQPDLQADLVFFAFWLSHVPPEYLGEFLTKVHQATRPNGHVFIIDSLRDPTSSALNHEAYQPDSIYHTRKLNDGRSFKIIKVFYEPQLLQEKLAQYGFEADVKATGRYFLYTVARKTGRD